MSAEHGTKATRTAVEDSLRKTSLDYFDCILLHDPMAGQKKRLEAYKVLLEFYKEGKVKTPGVSNYGVHHLEEIKKAGLQTPGGCARASGSRLTRPGHALMTAPCSLRDSSHQPNRASSLVSAKGDCRLLQSQRHRRTGLLPARPRPAHVGRHSGEERRGVQEMEQQ